MIKIGIICPSEIAFRRFLPSLQKAEGFQYFGVAIANKSEFVGATDDIITKERQKAQTFVDNYGGIIIDGYEQMICSSEIDAIYLPLPPALHYQWAKKALEHDKHVLLEKPSTTCLADTEDLIQIASEKGLALHENYMFMFHDQLKALDDLVTSGEIGDVRLYRISFGFPRRFQGDFRYNKALGGGALLDAVGYCMKYANHLLGGHSKVVSAQANFLSDFEVEMFGSATMVNEKGLTAQIAFGMDNDYKCEVEIWGSQGTITSNRILTAPADFVPSYTIKKNQAVETRTLSADDAFLKSIYRFKLCVEDINMRKENYEVLAQQEKLVEDFKILADL